MCREWKIYGSIYKNAKVSIRSKLFILHSMMP